MTRACSSAAGGLLHLAPGRRRSFDASSPTMDRNDGCGRRCDAGHGRGHRPSHCMTGCGRSIAMNTMLGKLDAPIVPRSTDRMRAGVGCGRAGSRPAAGRDALARPHLIARRSGSAQGSGDGVELGRQFCADQTESADADDTRSMPRSDHTRSRSLQSCRARTLVRASSHPVVLMTVKPGLRRRQLEPHR